MSRESKLKGGMGTSGDLVGGAEVNKRGLVGYPHLSTGCLFCILLVKDEACFLLPTHPAAFIHPSPLLCCSQPAIKGDWPIPGDEYFVKGLDLYSPDNSWSFSLSS